MNTKTTKLGIFFLYQNSSLSLINIWKLTNLGLPDVFAQHLIIILIQLMTLSYSHLFWPQDSSKLLVLGNNLLMPATVLTSNSRNYHQSSWSSTKHNGTVTSEGDSWPANQLTGENVWKMCSNKRTWLDWREWGKNPNKIEILPKFSLKLQTLRFSIRINKSPYALNTSFYAVVDLLLQVFCMFLACIECQSIGKIISVYY